MEVGKGKVGEFLPVNNLPAQTHYCCVARSDIGLLPSTACVDGAYDGAVYSTIHVDLKARSHCGDINEASCQFNFIVLLQFNSVAAM